MSFLIKAMQRICMRKHIEYSLFFFDVRIFFLLISNIFSNNFRRRVERGWSISSDSIVNIVVRFCCR